MTDGPGNQPDIHESESDKSGTASFPVSNRVATTAVAQPPKRSAFRKALQFLWLGDQLREALADRLGPGQPGGAEAEAALLLLADADQVGETGGRRHSASLLYRAAIHLLIKSQLAGNEDATEIDDSDAARWAFFAKTTAGSAMVATLTEPHRALLARVTGSDGDSFLASLDATELRQLLPLLGRLAHELAAPAKSRTERIAGIRAKRWIRTGASVFGTCAAMWWLCAITYDWLDTRADRACVSTNKNLALHRPVTVVGLDPQYSPDPSALVDGDKVNLGFHAGAALTPNVTLDLGKTRCISKLVVFNRTDGAQDRAVPLKVEISKNNQDYREIALRKEIFAVWNLEFPKAQARYVRLTLMRHMPFHLAEVEVY